MPASSVIYVIGVTDNPVKVGHATSLEVRMAQLQTGNPDKLICHHAEPVSWASAPSVEAAIHAELKPYHRRLEWFDVHKDVAIEAVKRIAARWLLTYQHRQARDTFWVRIQATHALDDDAPRALETYRAETKAASLYPMRANEFILRHAGGAALEAFGALIAGEVQAMAPEEYEAADLALAKALNALAQYDKQHRRSLTQRPTDERALKRMARLP